MSLLKELSRQLMQVEPAIVNVARNASFRYKTFFVPKRTGGQRRIDHPSRELKAVQRALLHYHISAWPVHPSAMAYRPERNNILMNAEQHAASCYLLRMDFSDFFPSITGQDIRKYLESAEPEWIEVDRDLFVSLVTLQDRLTIGAPSSPALSNAICFELDVQLSQHAERYGAKYTRYADDLFFSCAARDVLGKFPGDVTAIVDSLPIPAELAINPAKTRHSSKRARRRVTGLTLGSDARVHVGRGRKREVRAMIHKWNALGADQRRRLAGMLGFIRDIDPDFINSLILKYGASAVAKAAKGA